MGRLIQGEALKCMIVSPGQTLELLTFSVDSETKECSCFDYESHMTEAYSDTMITFLKKAREYLPHHIIFENNVGQLGMMIDSYLSKHNEEMTPYKTHHVFMTKAKMDSNPFSGCSVLQQCATYCIDNILFK